MKKHEVRPKSSICDNHEVWANLQEKSWHPSYTKGKGQKKKEKKLTSVSFMYVCVAGNGEMLVFFSFFSPTIV